MEAVTQLTGVETKTGSNAKGQWTMYLFSASDGQKYQTFDKQLGPSLQQHVGGQTLRLVYDEKQNGDFVNRVATSFEVASDYVAPDPAPAAQPQQQQAAPQSSSGLPAKDEQIHRQCAAKVSAELLQFFPPEQQTTSTFWIIVDDLVHFFNTGQHQG